MKKTTKRDYAVEIVSISEKFLNNHTPKHIKDIRINILIKENTLQELSIKYEQLVSMCSDFRMEV